MDVSKIFKVKLSEARDILRELLEEGAIEKVPGGRYMVKE